MSDWRDDPPDWRDLNDSKGRVELLRADGTTATGRAECVDAWFDGEAEWPLWELTIDDGTPAYFSDFKGWRPLL